jgi:3-phenylpropionate/cinnamic acid dioxygenase small subunit
VTSAIEDELAIRRTLAEYCQLLDDGDLGALTELFAPDGSIAFRGTEGKGRDGLARWFESNHPSAERGKHISANPIVEIDVEGAAVTSDFVFFGWKDNRYLVVRGAGRYHDTFVLIDGSWRIQRREIDLCVPPQR